MQMLYKILKQDALMLMNTFPVQSDHQYCVEMSCDQLVPSTTVT